MPDTVIFLPLDGGGDRAPRAQYCRSFGEVYAPMLGPGEGDHSLGLNVGA